MDTKDLSDRPWVLLPGTLCTGAVFDPFLEALGVADTNRHFVELDRPDVAAYRDIFQAVTPDTVVCGFSLGAIVAAHAADQMRPHALVLFGLNPFADNPEKAEGRMELCNDVQQRGGAAALGARSLDVYGQTPKATHAAILAMAEQTSHLIAAHTQLALTRPGALPALAESAASVYCLTGSLDGITLSAQGRAAAEHAPNGRFGELKDLGHFALMEDPAACANAVRSLHKARHDHI